MGRKFGFTLAEVLITLAIIGVVAALTIPTLVQNYQKQAYVTALIKAQSQLTQANKLLLATEGVDTLFQSSILNNYTEDDWTTSAFMKNQTNTLSKYMKFADTCYENCYSNVEYKTLSGASIGSWFSMLAPIYTLVDGTIFSMIPNTEEYTGDECKTKQIEYNTNICSLSFIYYIDVNGIKGPNQVGRDMFVLASDKYGSVYGAGSREMSVFTHTGDFEYWKDSGDCNPDLQDAAGTSCTGRVLEERKMNY